MPYEYLIVAFSGREMRNVLFSGGDGRQPGGLMLDQSLKPNL